MKWTKINTDLKLNQLLDPCKISVNPPVGFLGHKSLGNSQPAEHLLDGQTALDQGPLTAAGTTSQGSSLIPGQTKSHIIVLLTALDVLHIGQGYSHIVL